MMADIADLGFRADTSGLDRAVRALNDVARAGGQAEASSSRMAAGLKGVAGAAIAATTAAAGLVAVIANQAKEADNFAKTLGISTTALQQFQAAAKTVGIESEKMGDIFKDLEDKIGEAFQEGTGEGAAALELLGLKAQDLIDLPVDQKLERIGEALGGIESRSGQISIMEMLADDGSRLLPLIDQNNEKLQELKQRALDTGQALSDFDNAALVRVAEAMDELAANAKGTANILSAELAPVVIAAQESISSMISAFDAGDIETFVQYGVDAIGVLMDVVGTLEMHLRRVGIGWTAIASYATGAMAESAEAVASLINAALWPLRQVLGAVAEGFGIIAGAMSKITMGDISDGYAAASEALDSFGKKAKDFRVTADDIREANNDVNNSLYAQQEALKELANSPAYSDQFKARIAAVRKEVEQRAAAEKKKRDAMRDGNTEQKKTTKELTEEEKAQEKANEEKRKAAERIKNLIDPLRQLEKEWKAAQKLHAQGLLSDDELKKYREHLNKMANDAGEAGADAGKEFGDAFIDAAELGGAIAESVMTGDWSVVGNVIGGAVSGAVSDAVGGAITESLSKSLGESAGSMLGDIGGSVLGSLAGSLIGGILAGSKTEVTGEGYRLGLEAGELFSAEFSKSFRRSSMFSSRTWTEYSDMLLSESDVLSNTFDSTIDSLRRDADRLGTSLAGYSGTIENKNGDLAESVDRLANIYANSGLAAIEKYQELGETASDTFRRLADTAQSIAESFEATGVRIENVRADWVDDYASQLTERYTEQLDAALSDQVNAKSLLDQLSGVTLSNVGGELEISGLENLSDELYDAVVELISVGDDTVVIAEDTRRNVTEMRKQLSDSLDNLSQDIPEITSRLSNVYQEAAAEYNQRIIETIARLNGVDVDAAASVFNELAQSFAENYLTATERLENIAENARLELLSLGVSEENFDLSAEAVKAYYDAAASPEERARILAAADALSRYTAALDELEEQQNIVTDQFMQLSDQLDLAAGTATEADLLLSKAANGLAKIGMAGKTYGQALSDLERYDAAGLADLANQMGLSFQQVSDIVQDIINANDAITGGGSSAPTTKAALEKQASGIESSLMTNYAAVVSKYFGGILPASYEEAEKALAGSLGSVTTSTTGVIDVGAEEFVRGVYSQIIGDVSLVSQSVIDSYASQVDTGSTESMKDVARKIATETRASLDTVSEVVTAAYAVIGQAVPEGVIAKAEAAVADGTLTYSSFAQTFAEFVGGVDASTQSAISAFAGFMTRSADEVDAQIVGAVEALVTTTTTTSQSAESAFLSALEALMAINSQIAAMPDDSVDGATDSVTDFGDAVSDSGRAANEANRLLREYYRLTGNTAALREMELAALDPANRELQKQIWLIEDQRGAIIDAEDALQRAISAERERVEALMAGARDAYNALSESYDAEQQAIADELEAKEEIWDAQERANNAALDGLNEQLSAQQEAVSSVRQLWDTLDSAISDISQQSDDVAYMSARAALDAVLASGGLPSADELSSILSGLSPSSEVFLSAEDMAYQQAVAANQLAELRDKAGDQLSIEEQTLAGIESQIEQLEAQNEAIDAARRSAEHDAEAQVDLLQDQLDAAKAQLEKAEGTYAAVVDVETAIANFDAALSDFNEKSYVDQIERLDNLAEYGSDQIDILNNIDTSIKTIPDAISSLKSALGIATVEKNGDVTTVSQSTGPQIGPGKTTQTAEKRSFVERLSDSSLSSSAVSVFSNLPAAAQAALDKNLSASGTIPKFSVGGYTGNIPIDQVAGMVHGQEYVLNAKATAGLGIGTLDALNAGASPFQLFDQSSTMQAVMIKTAIDGLRSEMRSALGNIASNTYQTASVLNAAQRGSAIATTAED